MLQQLHEAEPTDLAGLGSYGTSMIYDPIAGRRFFEVRGTEKDHEVEGEILVGLMEEE